MAEGREKGLAVEEELLTREGRGAALRLLRHFLLFLRMMLQGEEAVVAAVGRRPTLAEGHW